MAEKIYLGDSVYAEFNFTFRGDVLLTTENGFGPSNRIYLEPEVIELMIRARKQAMEGEVTNG